MRDQVTASRARTAGCARGRIGTVTDVRMVVTGWRAPWRRFILAAALHDIDAPEACAFAASSRTRGDGRQSRDTLQVGAVGASRSGCSREARSGRRPPHGAHLVDDDGPGFRRSSREQVARGPSARRPKPGSGSGCRLCWTGQPLRRRLRSARPDRRLARLVLAGGVEQTMEEK